MAGFDVMVADGDGVIFHVGEQAGEEVRGHRVDIVVIIGGVVALKAVAGIDQHDIFGTVLGADAVDIVIHGIEGIPDTSAFDIGRIEPGAVDVVGGENLQGIFSVFQAVAAGNGCDKQGRK